MYYRFGRCELDVGRRQLLRDGAVVPLEHQVFELLRYLVEQKGRVCTREELLDTVWGHRFVGDGVLNSRVKLLRRAVRDDGRAQQVVRTVRSVGYEFVADVKEGTASDVRREGNRRPQKGHSKLPTPAASFVGREREIGRCIEQLQSSRLLALVGPGGVGKTRLALEVAERLASRFEDGASFVDLSVVEDPQFLDAAVASALEVQWTHDQAPREALVGALASLSMLLVLDTCEHVNSAASELAEDLAAQCSGLSIIATTRQAPLTPLAAIEVVAPLGEDAIELLVERASRSRFGFELDETNESSVREICRLVDGLPLAIELVAPRCAALTPPVVLDRIEHFLRTRSGMATQLAERHRTLEATIDWSYRLLSPEEQLLFDRLSVFPGEFDLDAIEGVCAEEPMLPIGVAITAFEALLDHSLVSVGQQGRRRRFRLLDTTRTFASNRLAQSDHLAYMAERHAGYFASWVVRAVESVWGHDATAARRAILVEIPNLHRAAEWAYDHDAAEMASALALAGGPLNAASRLDCGPWLLNLADVPGFSRIPVALPAFRSIIPLAFGIGDIPRAQALAAQALAEADDPHVRSLMAPMLRAQANKSQPSDPQLVADAWEHALTAVENAADEETKLGVYPPLLFFLAGAGDRTAFFEHWARFDLMRTELTTDARRVWASNAFGALAVVDPTTARPLIEHALKMSIEVELPFMTTRLRSHLAAVEARIGSPVRAAELLLEAIVEDTRRGALFTAWGWMHRLASVLALNGDLRSATVLHYAIPGGRSLIWAGDDPGSWLSQAEDQFGPEQTGRLAAEGRSLDPSQLHEWLRSVPHTLSEVIEHPNEMR